MLERELQLLYISVLYMQLILNDFLKPDRRVKAICNFVKKVNQISYNNYEERTSYFRTKKNSTKVSLSF